MYYLKQYNIVLAKFNMYFDNLGYRVEDFTYDESKKELLPMNLVKSNEGMASWLKNRSIPKNREFVDSFLTKTSIGNNNIKGIIDICKGLSLNDSYWISSDGFDKTFEEVNLYENRFSNILGLIAFTGFGSSIKSDFLSSPEFTTNGMLAKCWRRINGKIYLYKSGTTGAANTGLEPYSEYYASQIAECMKLDHVDYNISKWKNKLCSTCELFTDINHSFMPIGYLVKTNSFLDIINYYKNLGEDYYNALSDMIVFDAIICNTDRHYGNFGLIIDNITNKPVKAAPIFDNGLSLFNYGMDKDDLKSVESALEYSKTRHPAGYADFISVAKEYMTDSTKGKLKNLINFKFKKHPRYNLNDKRLKILEKIIQIRVLELLN